MDEASDTYDARLAELARDFDETLERSDTLLRAAWKGEIKEGWGEAVGGLLSDAQDTGDHATVWATRRASLRRALANTRRLEDTFKGVLEDVAEAERGFGSLLGVDQDATRQLDERREAFADLLRDEAQAIELAVRRGVLTGDEILLEVAERRLGKASKRIRLATHEMPMELSRELHQAQAEEADAEQFKYFGPADAANRRFCAERVGKVYMVSAIEQMSNGQGTSVLTHCGGWNCRHHWRASYVSVDRATVRSDFDATVPRDEELDVSAPLAPQLITSLRQEPTTELAQRIAGYIARGEVDVLLLDEEAFGQRWRERDPEREQVPRAFYRSGVIYMQSGEHAIHSICVHEGHHHEEALALRDYANQRYQEQIRDYLQRTGLDEEGIPVDVLQGFQERALQEVEWIFFDEENTIQEEIEAWTEQDRFIEAAGGEVMFEDEQDREEHVRESYGVD